MEVIEISSYTENEKLHIAMEHLIPKQLEHNGLTAGQLSFSQSCRLEDGAKLYEGSRRPPAGDGRSAMSAGRPQKRS